MIKTEQLYYLTQVAKYNSINKTADKLYMTSAAISTSIKQLEKECGFEILERTYRGVKLTAYGKQVVKIAEQILALEEEILNLNLREEKKAKKYTLVISGQVLMLLSSKIVGPGSKVLEFFKIKEVNDLRSNYEKYLDEDTVLVFLFEDNERERIEDDARLNIRYLYSSKCYPVSSKNTKWIKESQKNITKEEFSKLPKIKMRNEFDTVTKNVVLTTDNSTIYEEAIQNDYGIGLITKFAPDVYAVDSDRFKIYEPFDEEVYIAVIYKKGVGFEAIQLLESLIKNDAYGFNHLKLE